MTDTPPGALPTPYVPGMSGLSVMARGGYATVYRATQISVGREVAIKMENRTLDSPRDQARFLREARAAGRMSSHPHVVDLFDVGVTVDQHPYLIMELCDGSYLDRMRQSPLGAIETRDVGIKIADALVHSHANGVLHRDVKPANILYSQFNPAVLADFGLAVLGEMRDSSVTLEVLTPAYAPPEMFSHDIPSGAVDVYSLCATLYALMRGRPPRWENDRSPSLITLMDLFHQPIPDLPGIPRALTEVLRYGMANDPKARPTAEQLRELLTGLQLQPAPSSAPPTIYRSSTFVPPHLVPPTSVPPRPVPPITPTQADETPTVNTGGRTTKRGKRKWLFGGFGVLLLITASLGGAWLASAPRAPIRGLGSRLSIADVRRPVASAAPVGRQCLTRTASIVSCGQKHRSEAFAGGTLSAGVEPADQDAVTGDPDGPSGLQLAGVLAGHRAHLAWAPAVLPGSDRAFRRLARKG